MVAHQQPRRANPMSYHFMCGVNSPYIVICRAYVYALLTTMRQNEDKVERIYMDYNSTTIHSRQGPDADSVRDVPTEK
jgi:hypothetical protein